MKKLKSILLIALAVAGCTTHLFATHWRVNNTPGSGAPFTTIQQAHDDSQVTQGDTLYLEPSGSAYGILNWTKRLVILGNGIFLASNPETQANTSTSWINGINLNSGASGSVISGCYVSGSLTIYSNTCNIYIIRNMISDITFKQGHVGANIYILQNYIYGGIGTDYGYNAYFSEVYVENNYIGAATSIVGYANYVNNVIMLLYTSSNSIFRNNIIVNNSPGNWMGPNGNSFLYNICGTTSIPPENGNLTGIDMNNVFVCYSDCGSYSPDARYQLKPGSVAAGAGYGGVDCGMFDGNYPYVLSGLPSIPAIYYLNTEPDGNFLDVSLKIKSHN